MIHFYKRDYIMAETLKRVFWKPELVTSLKTFVENEDGGKFAKHVKDPLSDKPWTYFKSHWAKCFEAWKSTIQAEITMKRINVQSFKRKYKACCVNCTKEKARGKAEGIKTKNMQDMLNLARHRKQSFKTGGGRAVTPPPTPAGSDLDDEDLERLPVVPVDIEGADFSLPPDEVFQGSSSPVVLYRKNPHEPNQLTFILENGR